MPCTHEWYVGQCCHCEISVKDFRAALSTPAPSEMTERERVLRDAADEFRDSVLNQRHGLAENGMTSDQINDVLGLFDDTIGTALASLPIDKAHYCPSCRCECFVLNGRCRGCGTHLPVPSLPTDTAAQPEGLK